LVVYLKVFLIKTVT